MQRRNFLKSSSLAAGVTLAGGLSVARSAHAAGSDVIKVGLIGCGGRGRGALKDRLSAKDNVKVVAICDIFEQKAKSTAEALNAMEDKRIALGKNIFWGFEAYKNVIDLCDQALIVTTPAFRPIHYLYAVQKGKHVFMEKPCAIDVGGYKLALEANKIADEKKLVVVVGYQRHYQPVYQQLIEKIKEGAIGDVMYTRVYWNNDGIWERPRTEGMTEMEYQVNNWYHFNWLCGDGIVEQHCHNIDIANWIHCKGDFKGPLSHPVKVNAMGGREVRKFPRFKNSGYRYDHYFCEFTYADGSQMFSQCRHQAKTWNNVSETVYGTNGSGAPGWLNDRNGKSVWKFDGSKPENQVPGPYQYEHHMQAKWIREGVAHNDGWFAAYSSMTSAFGRMAACSGKELLWDDVIANGRSEFPYEDALAGKMNWDSVPPIVPDKEMPQQPAKGEFIYEQSVPVPGQWNWKKA